MITAGDATADKPEDLRDATPEELRRVRLALDSPLISIDLWEYRADISAGASDTDGRALADGIRNFINDKRYLRGGYKLFDNLGDILAFLAASTLGIGILVAARSLWPLAVILLAAGSLSTIGLNALFAYRTGTIRLISRKRAEVQGLSAETRKQLLIALVGAIVGALILGLAGLWAGIYVHH